MSGPHDTRNWNTRGEDKAERLAAAAPYLDGKLARRESIADVLYACIRSHDRVIAEGNNQKQADFLSRALADLDPERVYDLHMKASRRSWILPFRGRRAIASAR